MIIEEGLDALQQAEMVPNDIYELRISRIREELPPKGEPIPPGWRATWCVGVCEVVEADDPANNVPEILGRSIDHWLVGKKTGTAELTKFLAHKKLFDPEGGWGDGIPQNDMGIRNTENLVGVSFRARVTSYQGEKGWKQSVRPLLYK